ncbi:MAG: copper resistance protein B [Methylotenera sp.]|nr:copper resistance protein B [Methylotenera sp.]
MINIQIIWVTAIVIVLGVSPAWAQDQNAPSDAGMHAHQHDSIIPDTTAAQGDVDAQKRQGMNHDMMPVEESGPEPDVSAKGRNHDGMDHGSMTMQNDFASAEARDPHAYSDGYTLDSGPYALPGPRQLRLADEHAFGTFLMNRLEHVNTQDGNATAYDAQAWFGWDYDKLVIKAEGDIAKGKLQDSRTELLWGHAIASFWDAQLGVRHDGGVGSDREWLAFGVQGLAPYWFGLDVEAYVGNSGRTALRLEADYEMLLTQKLILQPRVEVNLYGKSDPARDIGSGLSDAQAGLRLRYEFTRQFAPYMGVEWAGKFGSTADYARAAGEKSNETRWVAGVRFWF